MRIRLTIQRNALPAAKILWTIPDTNSAQGYTISRLLEDVNHVIPLESEHWGLEHYVVEIDGFECLHFSPVAETLKENDDVCIRPLLTAEVRARTLTGRDQITDDGCHLVDGIPFGRPYLRRPNRPDLRIPAPSDTPAITSGPSNFELGSTDMELPAHLPAPIRGLLQGLDLSDPKQREEAQESLALAHVLSKVFGPDGPSPPSSDHLGTGPPRRLTNGNKHASQGFGRRLSKKGSKQVQFAIPEQQADDLDSEEDDEDFEPGDMDGAEDMEEESDDDSESSSDSSSASDSSSTGSESDSDSDDSSSDGGEESDASSAPEVRSSKGKLPVTVPALPSSSSHVAPGKGRRATHARNQRRTRTNRLRHLQQSGKLPSTATLQDLTEYENGVHEEASTESTNRKPYSNWAGKRKRIEGEDDETSVLAHEHRKEELTMRFGKETASTMVEAEDILQQTSAASQLVSSATQPVVETSVDQTTPEKETPRKRLRPDTSAISRILARQAAPLIKKTKKIKPSEVTSIEPEGASGPDYWKSRVNVSAFECWDEEFELSAPPFPFKQHWDPASTLMREKADQKKKGKKGKKVVREPEPSAEDEKIILDYDEAPASTENPEAEINAAIEDQLKQDVETAAQQDLPPLPEDVESLPDLVPGELKKGAVIVCKFFDINPVTVAPEISDYKTAVVEHEGDSGNGAGTIRLKLALRDLPKREKKFDKKGNQIYNAVDQFFMDEEDGDDGVWEGQFSELLEPKLLQAA